jgi:hypothetical protein
MIKKNKKMKKSEKIKSDPIFGIDSENDFGELNLDEINSEETEMNSEFNSDRNKPSFKTSKNEDEMSFFKQAFLHVAGGLVIRPDSYLTNAHGAPELVERTGMLALRLLVKYRTLRDALEQELSDREK